MVRSLNILGSGVALVTLAASASAHIAFWDPSMWGFNVTDKTFPYDNRPVIPLMDMTFDQWWFHGHINYPPNKGDFFELPAGGTATSQLACDKGATDWYASSQGGDIRQGDWPCPGQPSTQFHANDINDVTGCALAITYKSNEFDVKPEDFAVFSTNRQCVWNRYTKFDVPAAMPACPEEGCICAWFWVHAPDSGSEQNYMTAFRCKVTGAKSTAPVMKAQVPRRCGADLANGRAQATPSNCTVGAKQPFYWYQKEQNNMFEGTYSPPEYNQLYGYNGGAENDIFEGSSGSSGSSNSGSSGSSNSASKSGSTSSVNNNNNNNNAGKQTSTTVQLAATTNVAVAQTTSTSVATTKAEEHTSFTPLTSSKALVTSTVTATSSSAKVSTTRRCTTRKTKRAEFAALQAAAEANAKRNVSPHARHHNVGRFVHDTTLH